MPSEEIRLEKLMEILELPLESLFKLSREKNPSKQAILLAELKALAVKQRRTLAKKFHPDVAGLHIVGGDHGDRMKQINWAADIIHKLKLAPPPRPQPSHDIIIRWDTANDTATTANSFRSVFYGSFTS